LPASPSGGSGTRGEEEGGGKRHGGVGSPRVASEGDAGVGDKVDTTLSRYLNITKIDTNLYEHAILLMWRFVLSIFIWSWCNSVMPRTQLQKKIT
jgi:hypothetical protein